MLERFLLNLYERISDDCIPAGNIDFLIKEDDFDKNANLIPVDILKIHINDIRQKLVEEQKREESQKPYKKFMFVEDGSVDTDTLIAEMERTNPEIRIIVYRQGANKPEFLDLGE